MKMKWRTLNNDVDCGVFVMCHMDSYRGQLLSKWDPGFVREVSKGKVTQKMQLNNLRAKYCAKILLHDSNIHKEKIISYAKEFSKTYEGKEPIEGPLSRHIRVVRV